MGVTGEELEDDSATQDDEKFTASDAALGFPSNAALQLQAEHWPKKLINKEGSRRSPEPAKMPANLLEHGENHQVLSVST